MTDSISRVTPRLITTPKIIIFPIRSLSAHPFGFRNKVEVISRLCGYSREDVKMFTQSPIRTENSVKATLGPNHTDQLLDKIEDLLIENTALTTALEAVKRFLPPEAQEKIQSDVEGMRSNPTLHEFLRHRFAEYRSLSVEGNASELLEQDLKVGLRSSGL